MTKTVVTLDDKYTQAEGTVMLSALQAVVRLLFDQARRDRDAGLSTAGYVSGYRGSPITTLDAQLWASEERLGEHDIRFEPGLNEELAATSLRGTQQLGWYGKPRVDGVFALWYAKGVGVERAGEAIKAANFEGTHKQRRRAAVVRRRSCRQVVADRAPVRARAGHRDGAGALPGDHRRDPRWASSAGRCRARAGSTSD